MIRSFKANAIRRVFAICKDRAVVIKAKTNDHTTLHAPAAHALYLLCGCLRWLLCAGSTASFSASAVSFSASAAAWQAERSMQPTGAWTLGMLPCSVVRRVSPVVVVA